MKRKRSGSQQHLSDVKEQQELSLLLRAPTIVTVTSRRSRWAGHVQQLRSWSKGMAKESRLRDNIKTTMIGFWISDGEEIVQKLRICYGWKRI
jgi:predicted aldo/keto reductase-like oxidoreductase